MSVSEFTWTWKKNLTGLIYDISIFKNGEAFGYIPDIHLRKAAVINGHNFIVHSINKNFKLRTFLIEPYIPKICCEIKTDKNRLVAKVDKNTSYLIGIEINDNPNADNNLDVQLYKDKMFFANSGKLIIRSAENIELLIACTFYAYQLKLGEIN